MKIEPDDLATLKPLLRELLAEVVAELRPEPQANGNGRVAYGEAEAAAMLGLEVHQLREQRRRGFIQCCPRKPGGRILYTRQQIEAFLRTDQPPKRTGGDKK